MLRRMFIASVLLATSAAVCAQNAASGFVISGKTVNAITGQTLAGTEVFLYKTNPADIYDIDPAPQRILTGEDGRFTFHVQDAGKYALSGQRTGFQRQGYEQHGFYFSAAVAGPGIDSEHLVFRLSPDCRISGTVVDDDHEPVRGATVYLFRTDASGGMRKTVLLTQTTTDDRGRYRFPHLLWGWYSLAVMGAPWWTEAARMQALGGQDPQDPAFNLIYATQFYPGVSDAASAKQIALNEGEDFTADFTVTAVASAKLRLPGLNAHPEVMRRAQLKQKVFGVEIEIPTQLQAAGEDSMEIGGVPPGQYLLEVQTMQPMGSPESSTTGAAPRAIAVDLTGDTEIDVDEARAVPPITGSVAVEEGGTRPAQLGVTLWNSKTREVAGVPVNPDGTFGLDATTITSGTYSVFVGNMENSLIAQLSAKGAKVVGQTVEITRFKPLELKITLAKNLSKIKGTAIRDGKPVAGAMILLVPENPDVNLPRFRRDQSDSDGTFTLRDVMPGHYRILALDNAWDAEWANGSVLKGRLEHAQSADVQAGRSYDVVVGVE